MRKKITDNLGLKILAVLFSTALWLIVVNISDPVEPAYFYSVPVDIINADSITGQGKVYEVLDGTDSIDVVVRANRSIADSLVKDNIKAVADMNELTFMDTVRINLSSNKSGDKLDSITSSTENLKLSIENIKRTQLVITCVPTGEPEKGYILGNITTDQNVVALSGPESAISQIDKVVANVSVGGMTSDISTKVAIKLYDKDNNIIDNKNITKNIDSVNVNIEVLKTAEVPFTFTTVGTPAEGYVLSGDIVSTPETVRIAGKEAAVDAVKAIEIADINITGQTANLVTNINVKDYLPDDVSYAGKKADATIAVTAKIAKEVAKTFKIPKKNIALANAPADKITELTKLEDEITITVLALPEVMNTLQAETILGFVDINTLKTELGVEEMKAGIYSGAIEFLLPKEARIVETIRTEVVMQDKESVEE